MKRVGIITYHNANNLGAVLQAYALQEKVKELNENECLIIDYGKELFKESANGKGIKNILKNIYYKIKNVGFEKFRKQYLNLSKEYTKANIQEVNSEVNLMITGSDQVWNLSCSNNDYTYFLDFADDRVEKVSYAASLGNYTYSNSEKSKIIGILHNFKNISIREEDSLSQFDNLEKEIEVMPDPVFLLSKNEWSNRIPKRLIKEKYILVYLIQDDVNVMREAINYAEKNNLKIISNKKSIQFIFHNSPLEFLSWIYYAEKIFTNSFHGTAFSLILEKELAADIELKNGKINNRIQNILKEVSGEKYIIGNESNVNNNSNLINAKLEKLRKKGINFLKKILK